MNRIRITALLLAASVLLCLCCSACVRLPWLQASTAQTSTAEQPPKPTPSKGSDAWSFATAPTVSASETRISEADGEIPLRWQNAGKLDFLSKEPISIPRFSELEYVRPDTETLFADFDALTEQAANSKDAEALLEGYYDLYCRYQHFYTMLNLAFLLYAQDTTRTAEQSEYDFCQELSSFLEEKFEALLLAFAASACRDELEQRYFGKDYFLLYDDYSVYTNKEYLRLVQQEAALLSEYRTLTASLSVTYQGQTKLFAEWMQTDSYFEYFGVLSAYFEQYHEPIGNLFVELVKVRQQLAASLGYESYAAYSYAQEYTRDFTPEEGALFLEGIRTHLVPVAQALYEKDPWNESSQFPYIHKLDPISALGSAAESIGGSIGEAFRFMRAYELCDLAAPRNKLDASFTTYLYDYEAPFIFINPMGDETDFQTLCHEFGHFTDFYHNYGDEADFETAETYSQTMEFLAPFHAKAFSKTQKEDYLRFWLRNQLENFIYQGAYADFERRIYALSPAELTLDAVDAVYRQCCTEYGINSPDLEQIDSMGWIQIFHFFEAPFYVISYCVSAQPCLELCRMEVQQQGAGVEAFLRLLDRSPGAGFSEVLSDAKLDDPFRKDALKTTADYFASVFSLR